MTFIQPRAQHGPGRQCDTVALLLLEGAPLERIALGKPQPAAQPRPFQRLHRLLDGEELPHDLDAGVSRDGGRGAVGMLDDRVAERLVRAHHLERDRGRGPAPVRRAAVGAEAHLEVGRHVALARVGEPCQLSDVAILERFAGDLAAELALAREDRAHLVDRHADVCRIAVVAGPVARARLRGEVLPEGLAAAVGELRTVRCERLLDLAGIVLLVRLAVVDIPAMARERVQHSGELTGVQQITESL